MKLSKVLKKDIEKYLGIIPDKRRKDFKQFIAEKGGFNNAIESLKSQLDQLKEFKVKKEVRQKQVKVQKKYESKKREAKKERYIGNILVEFRITEDRRNDGGGFGEYYLMKKVYEYRSKFKTIYKITVNIRFDKLTTEKQLPNEINEKVEDQRKYILVSDGYIIDVEPLSIKSDIHKYSNGQKYEDIKMKNSVAFKYDGYDKQDWDTNTGRCVFDYIIHTYKDIPGFKKICNYDELNKIFRCYEGEDCLNDGVNTIQIKLFCCRFNLPMYALDDDERVFDIYQPESRNKKAPMMMFRISNNHFHPIPKKKQQSILQITSLLNSTSDLITVIKPKEEETKKQIIENTIILEDTNAIVELGKVLNETKTIPNEIKMYNKKISSFVINNTQYTINQNIALTKLITENMGLKYEGQSLGNLIGKIIDETIKHLPKSNHNPNVFNQLITAKKGRAFNGLIKEDYVDLLENPNTIARDITKCYTSIMYDPMEEWIRLDFNDCWTKYNGELIELGLYYVKTEDISLFKKSDIYSSAIINKAIEEGIKFTITHKLISKYRENKNLFVKIIDRVVEISNGDSSLYKLMINMISGLLGKNKTSVSNCNINSNVEHIFHAISEYEKLDKRVFINKIPETDYYIYGVDDEVLSSETNLPMYIQVLDQSNIKVYDMVKQMKGKLIGRKVDCAVIHYPNGNLPEEVNGDTNKVLAEQWGSVRSCGVPVIDYEEEFKDKQYQFNQDWKDWNINDSDDWKKIMEVMIDNGGLLLKSDAGNGKSYVAKQISKTLTNVKKLAPTNKAALNIKGSTIHRFLKMDEEGNISRKVLDSIKRKYKYMIVDEISMISKDIWKRLVLLKQATGIIFLLIGDDKQLEPVEDEDIDDYFNHPAVHYLANNNRNILTIRKRFDERLYNYLKNVDELDLSLFAVRETKRNLCYYNRTRKHINKYWNEKLKTDDSILIKEDIEDDYTQDMYIYKDLPVIARKTEQKGEMCMNNETFEVLDFDDDKIYLGTTRPNEEGEPEPHSIEVDTKDFNELFALNYCSTTHKTQGETIEEDFTIYDWERMNTKCRYTALSRARRPEQVSFGKVELKYEPETFETNIKRKIAGHLKYDKKKKLENNLSIDKVMTLYEKQNGECKICGCHMKTVNYKSNDGKQFSIDRINPLMGHTDENIQLLCWNCNRGKSNRF